MAWDDTKGLGDNLTSTEWNNHVTDQKTRLQNVVEDTTPQLGGALDAQNNNITAVGSITVSTLTIDTVSVSSISTGTANNDKLATQGYVDDNAGGGGGSGSPMFTISMPNEITTGTIGYFCVPDEYDSLVIKEVRISTLSLPTGADIQIDIRKNGTASTDSIYTSDVPQEIATTESTTNGVYQTACDTSGARVGTPGTTLDSARDDLSSDDVLYAVVSQVGSTLTGSDLRIEITLGSA